MSVVAQADKWIASSLSLLAMTRFILSDLSYSQSATARRRRLGVPNNKARRGLPRVQKNKDG